MEKEQLTAMTALALSFADGNRDGTLSAEEQLEVATNYLNAQSLNGVDVPLVKDMMATFCRHESTRDVIAGLAEGYNFTAETLANPEEFIAALRESPEAIADLFEGHDNLENYLGEILGEDYLQDLKNNPDRIQTLPEILESSGFPIPSFTREEVIEGVTEGVTEAEEALEAIAAGIQQAVPGGIEEVTADHVCNSGVAVSQGTGSDLIER